MATLQSPCRPRKWNAQTYPSAGRQPAGPRRHLDPRAGPGSSRGRSGRSRSRGRGRPRHSHRQRRRSRVAAGESRRAELDRRGDLAAADGDAREGPSPGVRHPDRRRVDCGNARAVPGRHTERRRPAARRARAPPAARRPALRRVDPPDLAVVEHRRPDVALGAGDDSGVVAGPDRLDQLAGLPVDPEIVLPRSFGTQTSPPITSRLTGLSPTCTFAIARRRAASIRVTVPSVVFETQTSLPFDAIQDAPRPPEATGVNCRCAGRAGTTEVP